MKVTIGENSLSLKIGDITEQATDFIVNAANGSLLGGGGVDGAIHQIAGPELLETNKQVREYLLAGEYLPTGEVVITKGFHLPATYVIHTVGPIWENKGTEKTLLANCYVNSLALAYMMDDAMQQSIDQQSGFLSTEVDLQKHPNNKKLSISFPSISTGVYRFPIEEAAEIALKEIYQFLSKYTGVDVIFVLFSEADYAVYKRVLVEISSNGYIQI